MVVTERLELAVGPSVQDPILDTGVGILGLVLGLVPGLLDLGNQRVLVCLCGILNFDALLLKVFAQLLVVPLLVRADCMVFPVVLDELLEILAVGGSWVRDVVVGKPTLELGLVPLVICLMDVVLAYLPSYSLPIPNQGCRCSSKGKETHVVHWTHRNTHKTYQP